MKSGFVAVVGRTSVGKSTLVNRIVGKKVSITATTPHTTRSTIRGIYNGEDAQIVLVDTPGIHRPSGPLSGHLNLTAAAAIKDSPEVVMLVVDGHAGIGPGDIRIAKTLPQDSVVVINKIDRMNKTQIAAQLMLSFEKLGFRDNAEYVPVSAASGGGIDELREVLKSKLSDGPAWFDVEETSDVPEDFYIAELIREQVLKLARDELPSSIACQIKEWEPAYMLCEIIVERDSQKPIVLGKGGKNLGNIRRAVQPKLPKGTKLELVVSVNKNWKRNPERLGYF